MSDPPRRKRLDPRELVAKVRAEERKLAAEVFIAPVVPGGRVRVRVLGLVYEMEVTDKSFSGWALLKTVGSGRAQPVGTPSAQQIGQYLKLFARVRLVLLEAHDGIWWAVTAQKPDPRLTIERPVPVQLVERSASFDTVNARFDGTSFWFDGIDRRRDPGVARALRQRLDDDVKPVDLHTRGMVPAERDAYTLMWLARHPEALATPEQFRPESEADRIQRQLRHAGASLDAYWQTDQQAITVRFLVDGVTRVCEVRPGDYTVISAGICLSGDDMNFDLTSLVGVLRESNRQEDY